MAKSLFVEAYEGTVSKNRELFEKFSQIHDHFKSAQDNKTEFDSVGKQVVRILDEAENRLCSKMENTSHGKYSSNLADKFRVEVRKHFPLIDLVGVTIN